MKKLIKLLIVLIFIYVGIQFIFRVFGKGHNVSYKLKVGDDVFLINEKYYQRIKDIKNHYDFNIEINKNNFEFSIYSLKRNTKVIKNLYYYKDSNYTCILPIFDDEIKTDFMCMKDSIIYPYHTIISDDKKLDEYIKTIDIYDDNVFLDNEEFKEKDNIKVYYKNIFNDKNIAINNYKGLYLINEDIKNINLFDNDIYSQKILCNVSNIYVIANYNEEYDFNGIYLVDLNDGSKKLIKTYEISFDSYIQGIVDNDVYLIDKSNKKQYRLNVLDKKIYEVGSESKGTKYFDGKSFESRSMLETINNELKFKSKNYTSKKSYDYVKGTYIYFKKVDEGFNIYKSNTLNKNLIYLFHVDNYKQVKYVDDYIYLIENNDLVVYHDSFGKKTLVTNSEFEFNSDLYYFVY